MTALGLFLKQSASAPIIASHVKRDSVPKTSLTETVTSRPLAFFVARDAMMPWPSPRLCAQSKASHSGKCLKFAIMLGGTRV